MLRPFGYYPTLKPLPEPVGNKVEKIAKLPCRFRLMSCRNPQHENGKRN